MGNSNTYWENLSKRIEHPGQTKNKRPDTSDLEIEFLSSYLGPQSDVIDIGSGTGLIINKLIDKVAHITAVEKFPGFTKFIVQHPNMLVIHAELVGFQMRKEFDVALCFGVAQCFTKPDARKIYESMYSMLKSDGKLIVRMQCGLKEDVLVDGFSEELGTQYFAEYRQKDSEIELLKEIGFQKVDVYDIFPDSLNVWFNSRHFIFVCHKKES